MDSRQVLSSLMASHASIRAAGVCAASHVPQTEEAFPGFTIVHVGNLSRAQLVVSSAGLSFGPPSRASWSVWLFAGQVSPCGLSSSRKPAWTSLVLWT